MALNVFVILGILFASEAFPQSDFLLPPPEPQEQVVPICSSYQSLCGLNYRYVMENGEPIELFQAGSKICTCADNVTCNTDWDTMDNAIVERLLTQNGNQLEAKISFCSLPEKQESCRLGDPVLVTKGQGQFSFELATPIMCDCQRPLIAQASWQEGAFDFIQYGCGQPRCVKRNLTVCAEVQYEDVEVYSYKYHCRCRRNEECIGPFPTADKMITEHTCEKNPGPAFNSY